MSTMKAIEINYYLRDSRPILHTDVVQIESSCANRHFMCRHCGQDWLEQINAKAQIISEDVEKHLDEYYPDYVKCVKR